MNAIANKNARDGYRINMKKLMSSQQTEKSYFSNTVIKTDFICGKCEKAAVAIEAKLVPWACINETGNRYEVEYLVVVECPHCMKICEKVVDKLGPSIT